MTQEQKITPIVQSYNESTVSLLEETLKRAKDGIITEVVIISRYQNGDFFHTWSKSINQLDLIGHLECLKAETIDSMAGKLLWD